MNQTWQFFRSLVRRNKRLKSVNILNADYKYQDIKKKINTCLKNESFLRKVKKVKNPYGEGNSAKKIVRIIKKLDLNINTQKINTY